MLSRLKMLQMFVLSQHNCFANQDAESPCSSNRFLIMFPICIMVVQCVDLEQFFLSFGKCIALQEFCKPFIVIIFLQHVEDQHNKEHRYKYAVFIPMLFIVFIPMTKRYRLIIQKNQIFSLCFYTKLFTCTFVQCTLPPIREIIDGVEQSIGTHILCRYAEYRYLLALTAFVGGVAIAGNENSVVGE